MEKYIDEYISLNKIVNKFKKKSTIVKCFICLSVGLFLCICYNYGKSCTFGLDDISYTKLSALSVSNSYSEDASEISSVVINWHNGDITINYTASSKVSATESSETQLTSNEKLVFEQNGSELSISFNSEYGFINSPVQIQKDLEISIPNTVEELTIKTVNGDIYLSDAEIETFKINVDTSNIVIKDSIIESLDIDVETGNVVVSDLLADNVSISSKNAKQDLSDVIITTLSSKSQSADIEISGDVYQADVSSVYGDINFASIVPMESLSLNSTVGDIKALVTENSGFILTTDLGLGEIDIDDFVISQTSDETQYYNNSYVTNEYEFSTSTGTIVVNKGSTISTSLNYEEYQEQILEEQEDE